MWEMTMRSRPKRQFNQRLRMTARALYYERKTGSVKRNWLPSPGDDSTQICP